MTTERALWAVVPVKRFSLAKQRLSPVLPPKERAELAKAMLRSVLDALKAARGVSRILVVTADPDARRLALLRGTSCLVESGECGLNGALDLAAARIVADGVASMLIVASDLPALCVEDIEAMIEAHGRSEGVTIAPSLDGQGTNALVLTPPRIIPLAFGENSFERHVSLARERGIEPAIVRRQGLALDLDRPADIAAVRQPFAGTDAARHIMDMRIHATSAAASLCSPSVHGAASSHTQVTK